ncbi:hypothetical protein SAMN04488540_105186 [Ferrimonas sediminum]|uniref:Uncharacterized protein n=1 Tax=Ferrimonas sediminum TaxID=718193 RepID=A0A1G8RIQ4_9GAMM|nr:hypothetical protein [Ferrimonas sediminum]SDJ16753.1 hypothetical protein SAMN04488540_105186 [Ferrimonas sediminum]
MKTPTKKIQKKPKTTQQGTAAKAVDKLDGQQLVELAQEGVKAYSSYNELRSERERTIQVKADALKEMQQSDNEVRKQQIAFHQRSKELEVEQYSAETERQANNHQHQQWQQDQQSLEKTIAVLRAKVATGDASADEIVLLQQLHSAGRD